MVTLHIAYTEPVNGNDSDGLILTREDVWNGLKLKARRPEVFIPSFDNSRVIEERENGNVIIREAHVAADLHESPMAGKWVREECRLHEPIGIYFTLPGGSIVQNIISEGPNKSLFLTFTYDWNLPDIEPGTPEAKKAESDHMKIAVSSVQGTIRALRRMATEKSDCS
ncbi:uncharacterized protein N7496_005954 [Penicillium cataractarum]|uniref:DUF1857 family protein n=1 Tax=Penicillium cataractarum TaxID=2100454 RepID=A0A9W9S0M4_9EURO|nr:uncharacterized protein N7496_005954 [Penicillium cataractarum]KAJ5369862.1 hypothetical protein N7496_005954 [Penicillium cataractarum]